MMRRSKLSDVSYLSNRVLSPQAGEHLQVLDTIHISKHFKLAHSHTAQGGYRVLHGIRT